MVRALEVEARDSRRIWLRYSDGSKGEVDLSDVAGRGVFRAWDAPGVFEAVHVAPHGAVAWNDEIELCADALYLDLTGKFAGPAMSGESATKLHGPEQRRLRNRTRYRRGPGGGAS